jgi:putative ABC transport system permease protein
VEANVAENESYLGILSAMFALSLAVGVLGVVNLLMLAVYDRIREIGLLRAVGAHARSGPRDGPLGGGDHQHHGRGARHRSRSRCRVVRGRRAAGHVHDLHHPVLHLGAAVLTNALLGGAASLLPARRAASLDILRAVASS